MSPIAVAAVLGAAVLHASWNALLRAGGDRLNAITLMSLTSAACGAVAAFFLPSPAVASWPFLASSAVLQTIYCVALARAYSLGLLAQVYPIARGSSPLLVTAGALIFAHEHPGVGAVVGVALVSAGILGVAMGRGRPAGAAVTAALATGVMIAAYTVTDGLGARRSGSPAAYACWLFLVQGLSMPFVFFAMRRRWPVIGLGRETAKAIVGGALSLVAYGAVIWALSQAPMGRVSALRETGILFAMLIGVLFLKERPSRRQLLAGAAIAGGAVLLA